MKRQLEENQKEMANLELTWQQRLAEEANRVVSSNFSKSPFSEVMMSEWK